jgi:hypothetical protein
VLTLQPMVFSEYDEPSIVGRLQLHRAAHVLKINIGAVYFMLVPIFYPVNLPGRNANAQSSNGYEELIRVGAASFRVHIP